MTQAEDRKMRHQDDTELVRTREDGEALPASLEETARLARGYFEAARAENTASAYDTDLRDFATWCRAEAGGLSAMPASPETVALYIADLAAGRGLKASTIRKHARAAGLDEKRYSAHSLRAGLVTGASAAGVSDKRIMDQTGHRSLPMIHRYVREAELFKNNPAAFLGL